MSKKTLIGIIIPATLIAILGWLGVYGLQGEEPRRALVSIEMLKEGDYIFPHMFGWMYYNKPPFFNWVMVGFFWIMGTINEWAVRMPSVFSLLLLALINWWVIKKYVDQKTALYSSFFILSGAEILFYGSIYSGEIDLLYSLVVYLQVLSFFIFLKKERYFLMYAISYFIAGISFMTKGLPAIPFQVLTVGFVLIYFRKFKLLFTWQHIIGIFIFIGIIFGYVALLATDNQEVQFIIRQFKEASQRTGLETKVTDTVQGSLIFPFRIIYLILPWSLFFAFLFNKKVWKKIRDNQLIMFSIIFILVNIPLYWFTGDFKARYVYPFIPFICIVLAYLYVHGAVIQPKIKSWIDRILMVPFIAAPLAMTAVFFVPELKEASINIPLQILLIIVTAYLLMLFFKKTEHRILLTILLLFVIRIGLNNTYIQALKEEMQAAYYHTEIKKMVEIADGERIYMSGQPMQFESEYDLGPFHFKADSLKTAPYIAFQIPYYITLETGVVVLYEENMNPNRLYLIQERFIDKNILNPKFAIQDYFTKQTWVLVKEDK